MRIAFIFGLVLVFSCNEEAAKPKEEKPLAESRHSAGFNLAIDSSLMKYDQLADAFVRWDSAAIPQLAVELNKKIASLTTLEANQETASSLGLALNQGKIIEGTGSLEDKRHALNSFTDHLFQYLKSVRYDRRALYLQECPMAFNDTGAGHWISGADTIKNPYLGLHHPKYGKGMLRCGENKDQINFTGN